MGVPLSEALGSTLRPGSPTLRRAGRRGGAGAGSGPVSRAPPGVSPPAPYSSGSEPLQLSDDTPTVTVSRRQFTKYRARRPPCSPDTYWSHVTIYPKPYPSIPLERQSAPRAAVYTSVIENILTIHKQDRKKPRILSDNFE